MAERTYWIGLRDKSLCTFFLPRSQADMDPIISYMHFPSVSRAPLFMGVVITRCGRRSPIQREPFPCRHLQTNARHRIRSQIRDPPMYDLGIRIPRLDRAFVRLALENFPGSSYV